MTDHPHHVTDAPHAAHLAQRIASGDALCGVIGLGYVGLPLVHALHKGGLRVLGFDIDEAKVADLTTGRNYLKHLGDRFIADLAGDRFSATADFSRLGEPDCVFVCLPTPLGDHQEPDLGYILGAAEQIGRTLRPGQLIVLESTTYPGTTREEFHNAIRSTCDQSLICGRDYFVAYSPEREDPGRQSHTTASIPKLVGGLDDAATDLAVQVYAKAIASVHPVASAEIAEAAKLLENIFRAVNIALVNEMKVVLTEMGIDVWEVVKAASTKPFGFMPFYPGPGLGGHCIPIDPFYLTWKAKEVGRPTRFIELAGEVNTVMPRYVVDRTVYALNEDKKAANGARVLVLGLAYKPDVDDTRESPAFEIIELFQELGSTVDYSDPHVPETKPVRRGDLGMTSVELTPASLASYDAVVIVTNHSAFDYAAIAAHAGLIIDTRNAMAPHAGELKGRLVKA
jgi:UDP-N-acetyl-D-glucosamine dehydrogenase